MFKFCLKFWIVFAIFLTPVFLLLFSSDIKAQVTINEFVPDSSTEWIEFYNSSASAEFLKEYYIDDDTDFNSDSGSSVKKLLTNLNISNTTFPFIEISFFLNNSGDWVVIFDPLGNLIDSYQYTSNPGSELSIGRSPDSNGNFYVLSFLTKGAANSSPSTTPTPTPEPTSEPTDTPTPTASVTSTPTFTPSPTPKKTATPKPTKTASPTPTEESLEKEVLGIQDEEEQASDEADIDEKPKVSILAIAFIIFGILFVGFSGFAFFKQKGLNNNESEKDQKII